MTNAGVKADFRPKQIHRYANKKTVLLVYFTHLTVCWFYWFNDFATLPHFNLLGALLWQNDL